MMEYHCKDLHALETSQKSAFWLYMGLAWMHYTDFQFHMHSMIQCNERDKHMYIVKEDPGLGSLF